MNSELLKYIKQLCYAHETQWVVMTIVTGGVFILLSLSRSSLRGMKWFIHPDLYLMVTIVAVAAAYAMDYNWAWITTKALYLMTAIGVGKAVRWFVFSAQSSPQASTERYNSVLSAVIALLALASIWPSTESRFRYHGHPRWTGPWENPNIFGILMGVGLILVFGRLHAAWVRRDEGIQFDRLAWIRVAVLAVLGAALANGLVHSYSRGAWLGTLCALTYLLWSGGDRSRYLSVIHANKIVVAAGGALALLMFWHYKPESLFAKRLFSVANVNDFSWRNRVAASEGMLKMITDRFWFGTGWNRAEPIYETYYCVNLVDESMAVQMNDYLRLGVTLGGPVLLCFLMYIAISFIDAYREPKPPHSRLALAGASVIATGFLFDGGLFVLPTAIAFFILMEMAAGLAAQSLAKAEHKPRLKLAETLQETT